MNIEQFTENIGAMRFSASVLAADGFRYTLVGLEGKDGRWHVAVGRNDDALVTLAFDRKPTVDEVIRMAQENKEQ